jgi:membrane protein implicated in regulation of membrane protease activity
VTLIALLWVPQLALIAFGVLLLAALAALLTLAAAIAATPYLLFRSVRFRWDERKSSTEARAQRRDVRSSQ